MSIFHHRPLFAFQDVIDGLLQNIFRIKNVLDAVISVVALAMILAIVLKTLSEKNL